MLAEDLAGAQRPGQIGIENISPLLLRERDGGRALDFAGAVDEDVDFAEALKDRCQECFKGLAIADVGDKTEGLAAARFDGIGCLVHFLLAARCGDDVCAGVGKPKTEGAANAGCAPGNHRGFAFKAE